MRYVAFDIETLGLEAQTCDVIEIGAILDNTESLAPIDQLPRWHCYVAKGLYTGQPYAMAMNWRILKRIADREEGYNYFKPENITYSFLSWLSSLQVNIDDGVVFFGKNVGAFDMGFMDQRIPEWNKIKRSHRYGDFGMYFWDLTKDHRRLPSLDDCLERAGIAKRTNHTALDDAELVVLLTRHVIEKKMYSARPI